MLVLFAHMLYTVASMTKSPRTRALPVIRLVYVRTFCLLTARSTISQSLILSPSLLKDQDLSLYNNPVRIKPSPCQQDLSPLAHRLLLSCLHVLGLRQVSRLLLACRRRTATPGPPRSLERRETLVWHLDPSLQVLLVHYQQALCQVQCSHEHQTRPSLLAVLTQLRQAFLALRHALSQVELSLLAPYTQHHLSPLEVLSLRPDCLQLAQPPLPAQLILLH